MWTHERRVVVRSAKGLHARPVALFVAYLRKVPPGTRFGLAGYHGPAENFGEACEASVFKLIRWSVGATEVTVVACGPHAEYVLDVAEALFGREYGPDSVGRDHPAWVEVASVVGVDEARRMVFEMLSACHERRSLA